MKISGNRTFLIGAGFIMAGVAPAFQNATPEPPFIAVEQIDVEKIGEGLAIIFMRAGIKKVEAAL